MTSQGSGHTTGKRERRKVATRKELLLAGRKLFASKGLYESRIEEITELAGIAKGTLYQYFENKEDLILAIVQAGFEDLGRGVEEGVAGARSLQHVAKRIVKAHIDFFRQNPDLMRIFHQARGMLKFDRREWRPLRRVLRGHLDRVAACLHLAEDATDLGRAERQGLAVLLFGAVSGVLSVRTAAYPESPFPSAMPALTSALAAMAYRHSIPSSGSEDEAIPVVPNHPRRSRSLAKAM